MEGGIKPFDGVSGREEKKIDEGRFTTIVDEVIYGEGTQVDEDTFEPTPKEDLIEINGGPSAYIIQEILEKCGAGSIIYDDELRGIFGFINNIEKGKLKVRLDETQSFVTGRNVLGVEYLFTGMVDSGKNLEGKKKMASIRLSGNYYDKNGKIVEYINGSEIDPTHTFKFSLTYGFSPDFIAKSDEPGRYVFSDRKYNVLIPQGVFAAPTETENLTKDVSFSEKYLGYVRLDRGGSVKPVSGIKVDPFHPIIRKPMENKRKKLGRFA